MFFQHKPKKTENNHLTESPFCQYSAVCQLITMMEESPFYCKCRKKPKNSYGLNFLFNLGTVVRSMPVIVESG